MIGWLKARFGRGTEGAPVAPAPAPAPVDWRARGNAALGQGDLDEAARCYQQGIDEDPSNAVLRLNHGFVLFERRQFAAAAERLEQALALRRPADDIVHDAHYLLGRVLVEMGRLEPALAAFQAAAASKPDFVEPSYEVIRLLHRLGRPAEAAEWERQKALRAEEALGRMEAELQRDAGRADALAGKAALLLQELQLEEAIATLHQALQLRPEDPDLHWKLAVSHLLRGEFAEGWAEYEWRTRHPEHGRQVLQLPQPLWRGESLRGRTIFIHPEQGLGDSLQFVRLLPRVAQQAETVLVYMHDPLRPLIEAALPANCRLIPQGAPLDGVDFQIPLMSLPALLCRSEKDIPSQVPYLRAEPAAVAKWRERLGAGGLKVGIAWSGNPAHGNDRNRSIPLELFRQLAGAQGCRFFTVQPNLGGAERAALAQWSGAEDTGRELADFADTAALMEALDVIVTVDTSVAHLAGALGRPVWVLLPHLPDWRWMLGRSDSPWYPTARLYRQQEAWNWNTVIQQVRSDLQALAAAPRRAA